MPETLPTIDFFGKRVSRLICGGNPLSGFSHVSGKLDREMLHYYTMPNIQALLDRCWENGINTLQSRGDRHQMRMYLEHREKGGQMQWIAQTASEFASLERNVDEIASYHPIAIYHHGTHTDNSWHAGNMQPVRDVINHIHDRGLPAGIGTHIPEVVEYCENEGWPVDFYMCCFYNLARGYKSAPALQQKAFAEETYPDGDPDLMTAVMRKTKKPCLGFKIVAASRKCATAESTREAFRHAFANIKATDAVVVGMFPKHRDQVKENAGLTRELG